MAMPIAEYDKWSKGARAYKNLAKEVKIVSAKTNGKNQKKGLGKGFDVLIPIAA